MDQLERRVPLRARLAGAAIVASLLTLIGGVATAEAVGIKGPGYGDQTYVRHFAFATVKPSPGSAKKIDVLIEPVGDYDDGFYGVWVGAYVAAPCDPSKVDYLDGIGEWRDSSGIERANTTVTSISIDPDDRTASARLEGSIWSYACNRLYPYVLNVDLVANGDEHLEPSADPYNWCNKVQNLSTCMLMWREVDIARASWSWGCFSVYGCSPVGQVFDYVADGRIGKEVMTTHLPATPPVGVDIPYLKHILACSSLLGFDPC